MYKIVPAERQECSEEMITKNAVNHRKNGLQRSFLAPPAGFEPVACRLGGDRSIQLNYGGLYRNYSILQGSRIRTIRFLGAFRLNFPVLLYQSTVNFRLFVILYTRDRGTPQSAHACKCCSVQTGIADAISNILLNNSLDRSVIIGNHSVCRRRNSAHWSSLKAALTMTVPCAIEQCCCHDRIRATYAYSVQFSALYNR